MTGFGRAKYEKDKREYEVEIKSVNHRYQDIIIKLPRNISYLEEKIKKEITANVTRGKVDVFVTFNNYSTEGKKIHINQELANIYIKELKQLAMQEQIKDDIPVTEISKFPDVLVIQNEEEASELLWGELKICLTQALSNFMQMRANEGEKMKQDLQRRVDMISEKIEKISEYSTGLVEEYVVKLETRVKELLKTDIVDQTRLAQEIVIYADKCSVEEELTRWRSHIAQFTALLEKDTPIGKQLDFIIQEMNRETNTIGSKSGCISITNLVIEIKTILEDMREQIQNIE